jgi:hypothetical protein
MTGQLFLDLFLTDQLTVYIYIAEFLSFQFPLSQLMSDEFIFFLIGVLGKPPFLELPAVLRGAATVSEVFR